MSVTSGRPGEIRRGTSVPAHRVRPWTAVEERAGAVVKDGGRLEPGTAGRSVRDASAAQGTVLVVDDDLMVREVLLPVWRTSG
jgi:hypothetical protein